jgi:aspartate aminotransferase
MTAPQLSPTLAINERVHNLVAAGHDVLHLGFGEAGLPVHPLLQEALSRAVGRGGYGPVAGGTAVRDSVAGYYRRRGVETDPAQIVVGPGSKALLFALMVAIDGDLVLPQPSWVSYAAQAALVGKRVIRVEIPPECGGIPDPVALDVAVRRARADGLDPRLLLLTQPDNPTGTVPSRAMLGCTLDVARACGLFVISDEIYADLAYEEGVFTSAAAIESENCVVTSGLSKSLALGGWRVGTLRVADNDAGRRLRGRVCSIASEIWSCLSAPIEAAATIAFAEPAELVERLRLSRRVHARTSLAVYRTMVEAGAECREPTAAFYLYPDLGEHRVALAAQGIRTSEQLATALLERFGIAVLPGVAFGDDERALRFRAATSLLYGTTAEERLQALEADELPPATVAAVEHLRSALRVLLA